MALNLANYEKKAAASVKTFWRNRNAAHKKQIQSGKSDAVIKYTRLFCMRIS